MINNRTENRIQKAASKASMIYEPTDGWSYCHHASITYFNGRFWAVWSNGMKNEDDCGQRVVLAESSDGEHWEKIRPIVTPEMAGDPNAVLTAAGFHVNGDTLQVYFGYYNYAEHYLVNGKTRQAGDSCHENTALGYVSTKDGITWSSPKFLDIPLVPNHGPQRTASGRLIIAGNVMFPYTDYADGLTGYQITGIYGDAMKEKKMYDDSESIHEITKANGWDARLICEGAFYQTDDEVLHMMLRSNTEYLWCSESRDDGVTWSEPFRTEYTDCGSKMHFGRLPDGRFYGVNNPVWGSERTPLTICISEDGENFSQQYILRDEPYEQKFQGLHKGGQYGYPHTLIQDGYLYVIYSKKKETIEVTKVALSNL